LILFLGGFLVFLFEDVYAPNRLIIYSAILVAVLLLSSLLLGVVLFYRDKRLFIFKNLFFILILISTFCLCEFVASFFTPKWPTIGLHGVEPELGLEAWGRSVSDNTEFSFNSWGQRDRQRTIDAARGVKRIVFVGDSLLEESSSVPFPVLTEDIVGKQKFEIINLGVSCSGPEDYYYRIKNIGIPLGIKDCFLFLYLGNDFEYGIRAKTFTFFGIVALYPRDSFFTKIGLTSLNHVLTNRYRYVLLAWGKSGELNRRENEYYKMLMKSSDKQIREFLENKTSPGSRKALLQKLDQENMTDFYMMLRNPDEKLFRSYYLFFALNNIGKESVSELTAIDFLPAFEWVKRCNELCLKHKIRFTLVLIPDAFNVDQRMQNLWRPLVDMKMLRSPNKRAGEKIKSLCTKEGIVVLDLLQVLDGIPGTYLNPDGHLSQKGSEIIANFLAEYIKSRDV
jgi:hypothetical protein